MKYKYLFVLFFVFINMLSFGQGAGDFVSFQKSEHTILIQGTKGILKITAFNSGVFKVQTLTTQNSPFLDSSYSVVLKPSYSLGNVEDTKISLLIKTDQCTLEINKFPLTVALKSNTTTKIREITGPKQTPDSVTFTFNINPNDVFHGAGSRPFGPDLNRKAFDFYNTYENAYYDQATGLSQSFNVPFIVASHQFGLLFDSDLPGSMRMYVGAVDSTKLSVQVASKGKWAYYLINGADNDEILANYTLLTGRQPLPPRWALGYIQSKFGYKNESEATVAASTLQKQGFPLDALVLDLYWYGDETMMGNLDWYAKNWPDPTSMMKNLAAKGVKTILITDPYITTKSSNYSFAANASLFAQKPGSTAPYTQTIWNGTVATLDIFKPAAQTWLWGNYKRLTSQGVSGWWTDKIEPDYDPKDAVYTLGTALQVHNLYALFWSKNLYENFRKDFPTKRLFNLTRSGWSGSQRYSIIPWSGDVARYWAGLRLQIPIMLQASMSGIGYMHSDTGGFATMSDKTEKDEELDLRWFQFGTFTPVLRSHGQRSNVEPFNLAEPFYSVVKKYLNIRYQLLPYIYSLAWKNSTTGRPICMPMDYFTADKATGNINDQYFFGENLLIAPVLLHGMPSRKVALPAGKWFDFWTNQVVSGDIFPKLAVDNIPVYAKAGGFVPLSTSTTIKSTDYYSSDSLTVKFYQDILVPASTFTMFHDDGADPNSLQNAKYELIDFKGHVSSDSVIITTTRSKDHPQSLAKRVMLYEIENVTSNPISVLLNGKPLPVVFLPNEFGNEMAYFNLVSKQLKIRYNWDCKVPATLTIVRDGLSIITGTEPSATENSLTVFPNPSVGGKPISVKAIIPQTGDYDLEVFNVKGRKIRHETLGKQAKGKVLNLTIEAPEIRGSYILKLKNEQGFYHSKKFVIE
jgi:oligosaccharide 4-alpha-D-glucosyltransferase